MLQELGMTKIKIPLPFKLNHVHCFLAEGENGYTMIDTGLHHIETMEIWKEILKDKPVERIILTHLHPDHCGYAGVLQDKTGADVWMTERDANDLQQIWSTDALPFLKRDYKQAAVPSKIMEGIIHTREKFNSSVTPLPTIHHFLKDGQLIQLGKEQFEIIFTPGHAAGLICLFQKEKSLLLSTDHVLPKITPNIAHWFYGEKNPLQSFENSLRKVKKLQAEHVVPSHGAPFTNANKRIDEIWNHHEKRLDQTVQATKNGASIFEICGVLFNKKLSVYDYQFAVGEAKAHLEYLRAKKVLDRELSNGRWLYFHK